MILCRSCEICSDLLPQALALSLHIQMVDAGTQSHLRAASPHRTWRGRLASGPARKGWHPGTTAADSGSWSHLRAASPHPRPPELRGAAWACAPASPRRPCAPSAGSAAAWRPPRRAGPARPRRRGRRCARSPPQSARSRRTRSGPPSPAPGRVRGHNKTASITL